MTTLPPVFISYARTDGPRVAILVDLLKTNGFDPFWDREIPPGKTWRKVLDSQLRNAGCVIVCWSRESVTSRWVQEEAEVANQCNKLLPLLLDDVTPPLGFGGVQCLDLSASDAITERAKELLEAVTAIISDGAATSAVQTRPASKTTVGTAANLPVSRRTVSALVAIVLIIAVLGGVWSYLRNAVTPVPNNLEIDSGKRTSNIDETRISANTRVLARARKHDCLYAGLMLEPGTVESHVRLDFGETQSIRNGNIIIVESIDAVAGAKVYTQIGLTWVSGTLVEHNRDRWLVSIDRDNGCGVTIQEQWAAPDKLAAFKS